MTFGERLREARTFAHLTLGQLAARVGVSLVFLSDCERGLRRPSADVLGKIERALGPKSDLSLHCFTREDAEALSEDEEMVVLVKRALRTAHVRSSILKAGR